MSLLSALPGVDLCSLDMHLFNSKPYYRLAKNKCGVQRVAPWGAIDITFSLLIYIFYGCWAFKHIACGHKTYSVITCKFTNSVLMSKWPKKQNGTNLSWIVSFKGWKNDHLPVWHLGSFGSKSPTVTKVASKSRSTLD